MYIVGCYFMYLAISLVITVWVAHTLHKSGRVFLVDAFHGDASLADSANHLLVVGFYLINVGWVAVAIRSEVTLPVCAKPLSWSARELESSCWC